MIQIICDCCDNIIKHGGDDYKIQIIDATLQSDIFYRQGNICNDCSKVLCAWLKDYFKK